MADVALIGGQAITTTDVDSLFEKFTIKEIHDIAKNTRFEIEKKKEDVRQMVGERYRDLIEAADTISEMKTSINRVNEHISAMEQQCNAVKKESSPLVNLPTGNRKVILEQYYAFAAQMKLLLDIPGQIWSLIEGTNFLAAAQLFLVARHVHTSLQVEPSAGIPFTAWHSLISRQWATISHFKAALVNECRSILQSPDVNSQMLAQCLSTLLVLGNNNIHQVFSDFLEARIKCIEDLFHSNKHGSTVRDQVCKTIQLIISTLHLVYTVFLEYELPLPGQESGSLLRRSLDSIIDPEAPSPLQMVTHHSSAMKYLPKSVTGFRLILPNPPTPIPVCDIQSKCAAWLQRVTEYVNGGLTKALGYITTIHGLSLIRDAILDVMNTKEQKEDWDNMCQTLLERSLNLWEEIFQPLCTCQVKKIVSSKLNNAFGSTFQQVADFMKNMMNDRTNTVERDITSFLWTETPGDLPANVGWISSSSRELVNGGNLIMKARGYTPLSQTLCSNLNSQLESLLEDLTHFQTKNLDSEQKIEDDDIYSFVTETTLERTKKLLKKCRSLVGERPKTSDLQDIDVHLYISRVLVLSRLWSGLTELCPALQQCVSGPTTVAEPVPRRLSTTRKSDAKIIIAVAWAKLKTELIEESHNMIRWWKDVVSSHLKKHMHRTITSKDSEELLLCIPQWEMIEIQEETEDGKMVTSTIRVPSQVSWPILSVLHHLCTEISRIGGHTIPKPILQELHHNLIEAIIEGYEGLNLQNPLLQVVALQLLFDLQFVSSLIVAKDDKVTTAKIEQLVESLESHVDPFDLDVFTPHIQTHLRRCVQRNVVLFGAITNPNKGGYLGTSHRMSSSSQTEQHSILCVATAVPRFSLLPLGGSAEFSKTGELDSLSSKTTRKADAILPSAPSSAAATSTEPYKSTAASFFEAMSTGWFRN